MLDSPILVSLFPFRPLDEAGLDTIWDMMSLLVQLLSSFQSKYFCCLGVGVSVVMSQYEGSSILPRPVRIDLVKSIALDLVRPSWSEGVWSLFPFPTGSWLLIKPVNSFRMLLYF